MNKVFSVAVRILNQHKTLMVLLLIAFLVRVILITATDPSVAYQVTGGDSLWYMVNSKALFSGDTVGQIDVVPFDIRVIPTAPFYLVYLGFWQTILPTNAAPIMIWLGQAIANVMTAACLYVLGKRLSQDARVGLVAAAAFAFFPPAILDVVVIATEPLYVCFVVAGLMSYVLALPQDAVSSISLRWLLASSVLIGLATLTRAVALLFPVGLAFHLVVIIQAGRWQQRLRYALVLLLLYVSVAGTWTAYNLFVNDRLVIGSNQLTGTFWRGAVTNDGLPGQNDQLLAGEDPLDAAVDVIQSDPTGYLALRVTELGRSFMQPYALDWIGVDVNLRQLASDWLRGGLQWQDFYALVTAESFWPQFLAYLLHFASLLFGLIGIVVLRHRWRISTALIGFLAYTTLLHLVLLALPRYLYPMYPVLWVFAAGALIAMWDFAARRLGRIKPQIAQP